MSQVTCRFLQACRIGNPQMAARLVVNFCARSADRSHGIRGKRNIPRGSWHHVHVSCYWSLATALGTPNHELSIDSVSTYVRCLVAPPSFRLHVKHVSNHLKSVVRCLLLSLPSVCSVQNERTEYHKDVNTWYILRL